MNTKKMAANAILIAVGAILHQLTPGLGIQSDFSLTMLFIIIVLNKDYKTALTCGIIMGVFAALTSKTPGGQLPNILDKFITANLIYLILMPLRNKVNKLIQITIVLPLGTLISGTSFLTLLATIVGLPAGASFGVLFASVVIPTIVINTLIGLVLFKIVEKIASTSGAYAIE